MGALLKALGALAVAAALAGCAAPAAREAMVPAMAAGKMFASTVSVTTRGGSETDPMLASSVSDADLKAAVEESIRRGNLFRGVIPGPGADYELTVFVAQVHKPTFGASLTVDVEAGWNLVRASDKSVRLRKLVRSTYTVPWNAAFAGVERLRLALEGATRENIRLGLQAIAELDL